MRQFLTLCALLSLALPVAGTANTRGDGTLSVKDLNGTIRIQATARGAVVGRCDSCAIWLIDKPDTPAKVTGRIRSERDFDDDGDAEYVTGQNLRWKVVNDEYSLLVKNGRDVDLTAVGKARVRLKGSSGTYSVDGGRDQAVPGEFAYFVIGSSATPS